MHDWLGDHSSYDAVIPWLDGHAFTYIFIDVRGYGQSIELAGEFTVEEIAADCLMLADQSRLDALPLGRPLDDRDDHTTHRC